MFPIGLVADAKPIDGRCGPYHYGAGLEHAGKLRGHRERLATLDIVAKVQPAETGQKIQLAGRMMASMTRVRTALTDFLMAFP